MTTTKTTKSTRRVELALSDDEGARDRIERVRDLDTNDSAFRVDGLMFANYGDAFAWAVSHPTTSEEL